MLNYLNQIRGKKEENKIVTEIDEKIVEKFKEGNTIASISKELKIDRRKTSNILNLFNIPKLTSLILLAVAIKLT